VRRPMHGPGASEPLTQTPATPCDRATWPPPRAEGLAPRRELPSGARSVPVTRGYRAPSRQSCGNILPDVVASVAGVSPRLPWSARQSSTRSAVGPRPRAMFLLLFASPGLCRGPGGDGRSGEQAGASATSRWPFKPASPPWRRASRSGMTPPREHGHGLPPSNSAPGTFHRARDPRRIRRPGSRGGGPPLRSGLSSLHLSAMRHPEAHGPGEIPGGSSGRRSAGPPTSPDPSCRTPFQGRPAGPSMNIESS